ncbi:MULTISPECIES: arylesterase [unclassified Limnohabitans]|uniref:arylesterase n=1 Tax=unclassified Limnohabitans TaxID=2626134 RepID=UPI0006DC068E|nr:MULTISPECIES: arylesterase [unclassified Limnohabitans]PUE37233.1 arylesterase [Limnohabitans sp. Hippo4]
MHLPLLRFRHFNRLVVGLLAMGLSVATSFAQNTSTQTPTQAPKVLIVGDSLSAEYGLTRGTGWVDHMAQQAQRESTPVQLINASISGDTTSGGVTRLPSLLKLHQPHVVIIELGGNDALRGLDMNLTQSNLLTMIKASQATGAKVLVIAMQVPPNYGANYLKQMSTAYEKVSKSTGAALNQQFLKGVADDPDPLKWFQADRIHPNEKAQPLMMKNVWPQLKKMLQAKP